MSFFDYAFKQMVDENNLLVKINALINWGQLSDLLAAKLGKKQDTPIVGVIPYAYISLFKALLLQQWHNLSDPKMEEALKTRIDFMWFTNFGLASKNCAVPDETTICRFRNKLIKAKILETLLSLVNADLELNNLKVKISNGAILDATLIQAAVNSNARPEVIAIDRKEDDNDDSGSGKSSEVKLLSANEQDNVEIDKDAKWLKKGKNTVFGYKNFVVTDIVDGYIEVVDTTPANVSEVKHLDTVLDKILSPIKRLLTDKGYASESNSQSLQDRGIKSGIMDKAQRNKPLTKRQKQRNQIISKTRYIVERTNATTTTRFNFRRSKYIGLAKTHGQSLLVAIAHNLLKAANKIQIIIPFDGITTSKSCDCGLFA